MAFGLRCFGFLLPRRPSLFLLGLGARLGRGPRDGLGPRVGLGGLGPRVGRRPLHFRVMMRSFSQVVRLCGLSLSTRVFWLVWTSQSDQLPF